MENLEIKVSRKTRMVDLPRQFISVEGENLQSKLVFSFADEFVNGQARLEYKIKGKKNYLVLDKEKSTYTIPVKNVLTVEGQIDMQLVITEEDTEDGTPVFRSNMFYLFCNSSINAVDEAPEGYELWIEQANAKLNQIDDAINEATTQSDYAKEQGDYAKEQGKKIENIVVDLEDIRNISEQANIKSETAISISKGANQSLSYGNYETMITAFNNLPIDTYRIGQNILIVTLNVPDLWISEVLEESTTYTFTTDENFANLLKEQGYVQVGYYKLSALETQKVDLTDYVKHDDYSTGSKGGTVKIDANGRYGIGINSYGVAFLQRASESEIDAKTSTNKPIVPSNLDYAVKSVVGGHETLTQTEYDELVANGIYTKEDGTVLTYSDNDYYNIVEE